MSTPTLELSLLSFQVEPKYTSYTYVMLHSGYRTTSVENGDLQEARGEYANGDANGEDAKMFKFADPIPRFSSTRNRQEYNLKEFTHNYLQLESALSIKYLG